MVDVKPTKIENVNKANQAAPMRLGERLIQAGFINEAQCEEAVAYQNEHNVLLGKALIALGMMTESQLESFFNEGRMAWSGERLMQQGLITREQLVEALSYQAEMGGRLGNAIVALGFATQKQIDDFYSRQVVERPKLGDMLVSNGYITEDELNQALLFQKNSGGPLGEILLSLNLIEQEQLYKILANQMGIGRAGKKLDFTDAKKLPYAVALKYNAIIINTRPDSYVLAVYSVLNDKAMAEINSYLDKPAEQVLATMDEIESSWEYIYQYEESEESLYRLYNEQPANSALVTLSKGQKIVGAFALVAIVAFLIFDYRTTLLAINIVLQSLYAIFTILKILIIMRGYSRREQLNFTKEQVDALDERDLPMYTLLIPIYKEAEIAKLLVDRLDNLDYPKHKLDIRILLEEDDPETLEALQSLNLPPHYTLLVVPDTKPHTKPKACNYGLIRAKGEYVVIYDAEDMPDRDQLKKAVMAFRELPDSYVCIQSKLNYFNSGQNILTRWFTQEYSSWFDILLIGVMSIDTPIPLGGTSNHFKTDVIREIGAWDPFNVTEDADLGVRLYKMDYKTAVLDSHTWEEANSHVGNWIRQRSRWIKGYMQTWLVHMRSPRQLYKDLGGFRQFIGYQTMIFGTPLLPLLNPLFWVMIVIWYVFKPAFIAALFPGALFYIAAFQFLVANFLFIYSNMVGVYTVIRDSEEDGVMHISYEVVLSGLILPIYWVLMSIAAYKALFQLIKNPFYWEKTTHGLTSQVSLESVTASDGE